VSVALSIGTVPRRSRRLRLRRRRFHGRGPAGLLGGRPSRQPFRGTGSRRVTTAGYLGFLAGPPVIGFVAQAFTLPLAFALVVLLALTGAALAGVVDVRVDPEG
jgi:hypothetical protein